MIIDMYWFDANTRIGCIQKHWTKINILLLLLIVSEVNWSKCHRHHHRQWIKCWPTISCCRRNGPEGHWMWKNAGRFWQNWRFNWLNCRFFQPMIRLSANKSWLWPETSSRWEPSGASLQKTSLHSRDTWRNLNAIILIISTCWWWHEVQINPNWSQSSISWIRPNLITVELVYKKLLVQWNPRIKNALKAHSCGEFDF